MDSSSGRLSAGLLATLALALLAAPAVHAGPQNNFTLDANAPGVDRLQVIVRGPDLEKPLTYEFKAEASEIAGGFTIPPGKSRDVLLLGFNEGSDEPVFRGTTLLQVDEKLNAPVTVPLIGVDSDYSIVATIGTYRVWATRESLGPKEGIRFRAGLIDGNGMPVDLPPEDLRWDVFDHPKNGVFPCATQEPFCVELRPPLKVNADVLACFRDIFCKRSPPEHDPYVQVAVGEFHTCARTESGKLFCWGSNLKHQLGVATPVNPACADTPQTCSPFPVEVECPAGAACRFISVAAAGTLTCAIDVDRRAWCWGWPGSLSSITNSAPVHSEVFATDEDTGARVPLVQVDVSSEHGCALSAAGDIWCFGKAQFWQSLNGILFRRDAEKVPSSFKYVSVVAGETHTCAVRAQFTGIMDCFGENSFWRISSQRSVISLFHPTSVNAEHPSLLGRTGITMGAAGQMNTCAKTWSSDIVCWGSPMSVYTYGTESVVLPGAYTATSIATSSTACFSGTCAKVCVASGPLHCGEWSPSGHLSLVPNLPQYKLFTQVDMGPSHQCALTNHGEIWCWGNNQFGQLGNGTASATGSSTPLQVTPIRNPATIKTFSIVFP